MKQNCDTISVQMQYILFFKMITKNIVVYVTVGEISKKLEIIRLQVTE